MRDLLLLILLPILLYFGFRKPFIGLSLWLWTSLVPMQTWAYGTATSIRWNLLFAAVTMIGYVFMKNKPKVEMSSVFVLMTLLLILATLSSMFHTGLDVLVWASWERFFKAYIFFVFTYLIVDRKYHVEALMWACVFSITATAAKQGIKVFFSGGGHVVYGMSTTFNDNNLSAFATLVCIPLTAYLVWLHKDSIYIKFGLLGAIFTSVLFVLGTDSRGGFLGLIVLFGFYFLQSKKKIPLTFMAIIAGFVGLSLMDASWFERMSSINEATEDSSFMGRVIAWKLSILMALQSPFLGGGFDAIAYRPTWTALLANWDAVSFIPSPIPAKGHVAHSIYFQVLGDLGFLGFFLFFFIVFRANRNFKSIRKLTNQDDWEYNFARLAGIALVCFLVAGAALSVAYNEITLTLFALSAKVLILAERKRRPENQSGFKR